MIIHSSFTGPTHLLSANVRGPVGFAVSAIISWLVKNGRTRNTLISLAKKYTMAPAHQLHHLYIRAHPTLSQHQYLRVLTEYFCLWRVTYSDESAQAILYHFPGPQASFNPPPSILLTCHFLAVKRGCCRPAQHLRLSQTAGSKLWISPPENQDRPPARQSAPYDSCWQATLVTPRKCQRQCRIAGHPDHMTEVRKNREKMWIYTLPHTAFTGETKLTHTPPTLPLGWELNIGSGNGLAWCGQATSHYLSHYLPRYILSYSITRPHWVFFQIVFMVISAIEF